MLSTFQSSPSFSLDSPAAAAARRARLPALPGAVLPASQQSTTTATQRVKTTSESWNSSYCPFHRGQRLHRYGLQHCGKADVPLEQSTAPVPQHHRPKDSPATVFARLYPPWAGSEKMSSVVSHGPCYCRQPRQRKAGFETVPRVVGCRAHEMICPTAVWTAWRTTYLRQAMRFQSACTSNLGTGTPNPSNNIWKENSPNTELKKKN